MKKIRNFGFTFRDLCQVAIASMLMLFQLNAVQGQGFYKEYHALFNGLRSPERIITLPGGAYALPMNDLGQGPLAWVQADAQGNTQTLLQNGFHCSFSECVTVTNDAQFVVADTMFNIAVPTQHLLKLSWYDFNSQLLQVKTYTIDPIRGYTGIGRIISSDNGHFYFAGLFSNAINQTMPYALEFDDAGNLLSQVQLTGFTPNGFTRILGLRLGEDGSFLIDISNSINQNNRFILRKDVVNGQEWTEPFAFNQIAYPAATDGTGKTVFMSLTQVNCFGTNHNLLWTKDLATLLNEPNITRSLFVMPLAGGEWLGWAATDAIPVILFRLDGSGNLAWKHNLQVMPNWPNLVTAGKELADGSYVLGGNSLEVPFLLKINPNGALYLHNIQGTVTHDLNSNCQPDTGDSTLVGRLVRATRQSDALELFAYSDQQGHYDISDVDTGAYVVEVLPGNYQWQSCGQPVSTVFTSTSVPTTAVLDFQLQALYQCPLMSTHVGVGQLRICRQNLIALEYCNQGTAMAMDPVVELNLPIEFTVDSASVAYVEVSPGILQFPVDNLAVNDCGTIYVYATLDCNLSLAWQTMCISSYAYPDTICNGQPNPWSGANIQVAGHCDSDSVRFEIHNIGDGNTAGQLDFVIVEDHVISLTGTFALSGNSSKSIALPKNGSTWRIKAEQEPFHPLGEEYVSVAVEGCVNNSSNFTVGMVNLFPNYYGTPPSDITCGTVLNSYDPNEKLGFPIGVDAAHYIEPNTQISYQINFQNTGNAPANNILLIDSLSQWLNPASLHMGAASHPYTWRLSGNGVLQIRFDGIDLPDSISNEPASHGFVRFAVDQDPDNPIGTEIFNRADIYFDQNPAVATQRVHHTVGKDFLEVLSIAGPDGTPVQVDIQPNPASADALILLKNAPEMETTFNLYDTNGKLLRREAFSGDRYRFGRGYLASGLYLIQLTDKGGKTVAVCKIMLK